MDVDLTLVTVEAHEKAVNHHGRLRPGVSRISRHTLHLT